MFSVFTRPVFLVSDSKKSNYFGPKVHGLGSWVGRARAPGGGLARLGSAGHSAPSQQLWSAGLAPAHLLAFVAWCSYSRMGF